MLLFSGWLRFCLNIKKGGPSALETTRKTEEQKASVSLST